MRDNGLARLHRRVTNFLAIIAETMPPEYRLTFIARNTLDEHGHVVCTDDDLAAIAEALNHVPDKRVMDLQ